MFLSLRRKHWKYMDSCIYIAAGRWKELISGIRDGIIVAWWMSKMECLKACLYSSYSTKIHSESHTQISSKRRSGICVFLVLNAGKRSFLCYFVSILRQIEEVIVLLSWCQKYCHQVLKTSCLRKKGGPSLVWDQPKGYRRLGLDCVLFSFSDERPLANHFLSKEFVLMNLISFSSI